MPLYRFYTPPNIFSSQDKETLSQRLTEWYSQRGLPAFYVNVLFIDVPQDSFYIGGKQRNNFVRITIQHIARTTPEERRPTIIAALEAIWAPFIKDRGLDWEMSIEQVERSFWRVQGLAPPLSHTEAEKRWSKENKATPFSEEENVAQ